MKRRFVPFGIAAGVLAVCLSPLVVSMDQNTADRYTVLIAAIVFACKAVLFYWIRHRMRTDPRPMTFFGVTLLDFFAALTAFAVSLAVVYGYLFWLAIEGHRLDGTIRTIQRAAIVSGGALIVATGIAVAVELRRSGPLLSVHEAPKAWDGTERRTGDDRRRMPGLARRGDGA